MQHVRQLVLLLAVALLPAGCAEEWTTQEKLDLANSYLSEYGGDAQYRSSALELYRQVLPEAREAGNDSQQVEAHFGIGMIGFLDLAQAIPQLMESMADDAADVADAADAADATDADAADDEDAPDLPPAEELADIVETLLHQVLGVGIVEHFAHVKDEEEFSFYFERLVFESSDPEEEALDLSGRWDLTEVRLLYGTFQLVLAGADYVFAYDEVIETVLEGVLSGGELPELPDSIADFPVWVTTAAEAMGFEELPWLDENFGVLSEDADLAAVRARMSDGFEAVTAGLAYVQELDRDADDLRRFPGTDFVGSLLDQFVELPAGIPSTMISGLISPAALEELFAHLQEGVDADQVAFVIPGFVWDLLKDVGGVVLEDYDGPLNPVDLGVPALNLSRLFTDPIEDIKDRDAGLLPWFDDEGIFALKTESPDEGAHDYEDLSRDAEWKSPCRPEGAPDPENGIVDPVYVFFCNADFNGLLVPIEEVNEEYVADMDATYTNADFMRLVSHVIWMVESVDMDTP